MLQPNARVELSREQSHYLIKVLRIFSKGGGEQKRGLIRCFDGLNGEWLCKVIQPDEGEQSHYLIKVLRIFSKGGGEQKRGLIRCFDGLNGEWLCKVIQPDEGTSSPKIKNNRQRKVNKKSSVVKGGLLLEVHCIQQLRIQSDDVQKPYLFFAPIKKQRAKALIEKCTECGAGLFFPVLTDNTDPSATNSCIGTRQSLETEAVDSIMFQEVSDAKNHIDGIQKLSMIACEAAEQSEQLSVPAFMTSIKEDGGDQHMSRKGSTSVTHLFEGW
eukprot:CAMPEP_0194127514 /NCGR_PEP_ID=MMETSP0150-20130528/60558_1 /TAXON_ID=122233 /ORGANISM="Chaetoceros debilis, Strain MM31A-1" /LENGTH=270 /DNA_ID=CAMNT_0038821439 /DNA_START=231 /DNA_END=1040 /DNA_ORIENTATION=-